MNKGKVVNQMEVKFEEVQSLIHQLTTFEKMYENTRIVDPVNKKVIFIVDKHQKKLLPVPESCFDIWGRGEICKNCISMRAYNENETFIKIKTSADKIIMVTAIPVNVGEKIFVVELLKDVTKSMILDDIKLTEDLEIKRLLDQANLAVVTDELTQIYNKRYIIERLPVDISISRAEKQPLSLLMADIDHFKRINDTYGHLAGDYILKEFAQTLEKNIRHEKDWIARFGGEEFIICLINTDKEFARTVAERMRKSIEETIFIYNSQEIRFTSSFGLCILSGDETIDYKEMIHCADKQLYEAKKTGRNKVSG